MSENQEKKTLFQDLWERRFFQYTATYLGVCWALIQFSEWMVGRYDLSSTIVEKLIVFLVIMLPAVLIFTYNHGRPGDDEWTRFEKFFVPSSLVLALVSAGVFFNNAEPKSTTQTVQIQTESGDTISRVVPKVEFTKRMVIFPFKNNGTANADSDWLRYGIGMVMDADIEQDMRILALSSFSLEYDFESNSYSLNDDIPLSSSLGIARDQYADLFVVGSYQKASDGYEVDVRVHSSDDGEVFFEKTYTGTDLFELVDAFSQELNDNIYLPEFDKSDSFTDLPASNVFTGDLEALQMLVRSKIARILDRNYAEATTYIERAVALDPDCAECYREMCAVYGSVMDEPKLREAITKAMDHVASLPERQQMYVKLSYYSAFNRVDKSMLLLDTWMQLFPNDYKPYQTAIGFYRMIGEWDRAKDIASKALEAGHKGKIHLTMAELCTQRGETREAIQHLEEFTRLFPHKAKENTQLGDIYMQEGDLAKAREFYTKLNVYDPNNQKINIKLADIEDRLGNFDEATLHYHEALRRAKQTIDSVHIVAAMELHFERQGKITKSLELIDQRTALLERVATPVQAKMAFLQFGERYFSVDQGEEYKRRLDELAGEFTESRGIIECVGTFLYHLFAANKAEYLSAYDGCRDVFSRTNGPNFDHFAMGYYDRLNGDYESAARRFKTYIDSTGVNNQGFGIYISEAYRLSGQFDGALEFIGQLLKNDPKNPRYLMEQAKIYQAKGDQKTARTYAQDALKIWSGADEDFRHLIEARELLASLTDT